MIAFKDFRNKTNNVLLSIYEESTFYIYRTDTNAVLARGINGFEAAKARANQIRKTRIWFALAFAASNPLMPRARTALVSVR